MSRFGSSVNTSRQHHADSNNDGCSSRDSVSRMAWKGATWTHSSAAAIASPLQQHTSTCSASPASTSGALPVDRATFGIVNAVLGSCVHGEGWMRTFKGVLPPDPAASQLGASSSASAAPPRGGRVAWTKMLGRKVVGRGLRMSNGLGWRCDLERVLPLSCLQWTGFGSDRSVQHSTLSVSRDNTETD